MNVMEYFNFRWNLSIEGSKRFQEKAHHSCLIYDPKEFKVDTLFAPAMQPQKCQKPCNFYLKCKLTHTKYSPNGSPNDIHAMKSRNPNQFTSEILTIGNTTRCPGA